MATSADWNAWLQQGQGQRDPLAPLNQQFGPLSGAPAQGYGQTGIAAPSDWTKWQATPAGASGAAEKLPFQNLNYAMEGSGSGNAASSQSVTTPGGPPPTSPTGLTSGNPNGNGVGQQPLTAGVMPKIADSNLSWQNNTNGGGNDWYNKVPEWTRGGGYPIGYEYNQQTKQWTPKGPQAAGTLIGDEAGWHTGLYLPSTYNPAGDTSSFESSTGPEKANARAIRQTADYMRANPGANAQHYFEYVLANLVRDQGSKTGYDPRQFAVTKYGEAYDPQKTYMAKGVSNPWTGKQAGNATGQDTSQPNLLMGSDTGQGHDPAPVTPGPIAPPTPAPTPTPTPTPTTGGGGQTGGGQTGKGFFTDDSTVSAAAQSPEAALLAFQRAAGGVNKSGPMGKFRENMMSKALQAYLSAYGVGGNTGNGGALNNANVGIAEMMQRLQNGSGVGDWLRGTTSKMMNGIDFSNMDSDQIQNILGLAGGAGTFGAGPMGQYAMDNALADLQYQASQQGLFEPLVNPDGSKPTSVLANAANRKKFEDLLRQYQAML